MLSMPLFKQSVRSNFVLWCAITGVLSALCLQFSALDMVQNLIFTIFYGMMTSILPAIYVLITSNKLLAGQVDRGSMAYVLSTPVKRSTVTFTQMTFLTASVTAMFGVQTILHLVINKLKPLTLAKAMGDPELAVSGDLTSDMIIKINLSAIAVSVAMGAVCFMFSGIFSSSKYSLGSSGTFIGITLLANMLAMFGSLGVNGLDKFKYLTLCSFYDNRSVIMAENDWIIKMICPLVISILAFTVGSEVFRKKDLPL